MRWSGLLNKCPTPSCQGGSTAFSRVCEGVADMWLTHTQAPHLYCRLPGLLSHAAEHAWVWAVGCREGRSTWIRAEGTGMDFQHNEEVACISSADQFWDASSELRSIPNSSAKLAHAQMLPTYFWTWVVALEVFFLFAVMCKGKATSAAVACTKQNISGTLLQESLH